MDSKKSGGYNTLFWGLGAAAVAGIIGSAYYIYTLMNPEEELSENELEQLKELQQEINSDEGKNGGLTVETAIQIMAMTNRISEEMIKKNKPDLDDRRRAAINNPEEYERVCQEVFESKEWAYNESLQKVLSQFAGISLDDIHKLIQTVPPTEIERINHKYEKPTFDQQSVPEKKLVKEAYIYYGKIFKDEMREFQRIISQQTQYSPEQGQYFLSKLLIRKMKVDDELYLNFKYTEPQITFMLYEYNLLEDAEIKRVNEQLMRFDQMFSSPSDQ
jgi:hypothetical protein